MAVSPEGGRQEEAPVRRGQEEVVNAENPQGGKEYQAALRDAEQRFRLLVETTSDWVWEVDENFVYTYSSPRVRDILGYEPEAVLGKAPWDFMPPEEASRISQLSAGLRESLQPFTAVENVNIHKSGRLVVLETSGSPFWDELGRFRGYRGIDRDISSRKQAENLLRASEAFLRNITDLVPFRIAYVDREQRYRFVNGRYEQCFGCRREDIIGRHAKEVLGDSLYERVQPHMQAVLSGSEVRYELDVCSGEGTQSHVSIVYVPHVGAHGEVLGFFASIEDITEQKRIEEALRNSERRLREAQEVGHTGYVDWDIRTGEIVWSDETCRLYGFEPGTTATVESTVGLVPPEDQPFVKRQLTAALNGDSNYDIEHRIMRPDGQVIYVHERGKVTRGADGTPLRMLGTVVDITERKRHEEERERLQYQLAHAQKMESVGRLAGGVAHDFNNLLTIINGYAAFLSDELAFQDPLRAYALEIGEAGQRAASLTSQLLAFSRKQITRPRAINLNSVVVDAERMLRRLIGEDIELITTLMPQLGLIMADPDQLHQVIINLSVNARDAMPNGGKFEIATTEVELDENAAATHPDAAPGRYVLLIVTDTGTGMTEEVRRKIFEPFFTTKEQGKGTGLGLSTVYGIVRQNGGWIEVKSDVGGGSAFRIHLPCIGAGVAEDEAKQPAVDASQGDETVLVVEDLEPVRRLAKTILEAHGYRVLEAASGAEAHAVAEVHAGELDLLLSDVVMPGMDGRMLSEQLRKLCPNLRVILMSGYAEDIIAHRGVIAPTLAYIKKPFQPRELAAKVRKILDGPLRP